MVLAIPIVRHTMKWTLPGAEVAACSIHWHADPLGPNTLAADGLRLESKAATMWTAIKAQYSSEIAYVGSTSYLIDVDGKVAASADFASSPVPGTSGSASLPHEVACCVSLSTLNGRRTGKGRIYLPPPDVNRMAAGGRFTLAFQNSVVNALLDDVTSSSQLRLQPHADAGERRV